MPSPFDQAKGYGFWVSEMEITTGLIWWQPIIDVYFLRSRTPYRSRKKADGVFGERLADVCLKRLRLNDHYT